MMIRRITDYLEKTYKEYPNKTAYTDNKCEISFKELRDRALNIAGALSKKDLFKMPVVVYMEKSVAALVSFFGSAYSGNFYTPIDPSMPDERVIKINGSLSPAAVITNAHFKAEAEDLFPDSKILIYEDITSSNIDKDAIIKNSQRIIDTDILYIIYTSGSTGTPKGVCLPHRAVIDYIEWFTEKFDITPEDEFGNQVPLYFDLSIQDVFSPLKTGCTTHLIEPSMFSFPKNLMDYLCKRNVNVIVWVPTALCLMASMKALKLKELPKLEKVFFAGEVMPVKQLNKWMKAYPDTMFVNMYGPTELANIATWYIIDRALDEDEPVPMGFPCENIDVMVLNENDLPVLGDGTGELCVRGTCLAHGYYNDPEKTAEVFVQNPLNGSYHERIYRTGDLVRYNEYGELVYVSRKDFQVKHMGYRIELGEIESVLSALHGMEMNCCLYDYEKKSIILVYTGRITEDEIICQAKEKLPDYMIPGRMIRLDSMPLNQNGKIDRVRLKGML